MKLSVEQIASVAHNVNRAFCEANGDHSQVDWIFAPGWQKESAIKGVEAHIQSGLTMTPEGSHVSWMNEKFAQGWQYGDTKDPVAKTHPCIKPYDELPLEQRAKDFIFREVVHSLVKLNALHAGRVL